MPKLEQAARQALGELEQYIAKELTLGQRYTNEGQGLLDAHVALREALNQTSQDAEDTEDTARLDWLLWKLPGDALRYVVGELSDTSDAAVFRASIDAARTKGGKQ